MKMNFEWEEIDFSKTRKTSGEVVTLCPACSHTRKKKTDKCLGVNLDKGVARCNHCGAVSHKESDEIKKEDVIYELPNQQWQNNTSLSDNIVKWFKDKRKISQQTLIECKVTEERIYFPQKKKELNAIAFNYFDGDILVTSKYRSGDKDFMQTKNTRKIFYGVNDIKDSDEVVCVEGEIDKLAFWEAGIKNVISVPNGASDISLFVEGIELFEDKKIVLAVDNDKAGKILESAIIEIIGKDNCSKIIFPKGCKDANDVLIKENKFKLLSAYENRKSYNEIEVENLIYTSEEINDTLLDFLEGRIEMGMTTGVSALDNHFSYKKNEFYLLTGNKGSGKTSINQAIQLMGSLANDIKWVVAFQENSAWSMKLNFMNYILGKWAKDVLKDNPNKYYAVQEWVDEHFIFLKVNTINDLIKATKVLIEDKGIDVFGVLADPINSFSV